MRTISKLVRLSKPPKQLPSTSQAPNKAQVPTPPPPSQLPHPSEPLQPPKVDRKPQIIDDRYIDELKLYEICKQRFGIGNYTLRCRFNKWYIDAPAHIDEDTLVLCEIRLN